jgi:hypothetical protein
MPIINQVVMQVLPAINAWSSKWTADAVSRRAGATNGTTVDPGAAEASAAEARATEAKAEEQRVAQAEQEHAAKLAAAIAAASSPGPGIDVVKLLQLLPPRTSTKLVQIQMALFPDEQADAMQILRGYRAEGIEDLLTVFDAASLDECKTFLRILESVDAAIAASRRRGMIPHGKSPLGMENIRCGSQDRKFMDPIYMATSGGWSSALRTAARKRCRLRRRPPPVPTRPGCSRRSPDGR